MRTTATGRAKVACLDGTGEASAGARLPDPLLLWGDYARAVRDRLEQGKTEYRDRSFSRDSAELLEELQQEALDLAGWGFVLWHRLEQMREALGVADRERRIPT